MIAVINDLPFRYQFPSREDAIRGISVFIHLCKDIESGRMTKIEKIKVSYDLNFSSPLAPGFVLAQLLRYNELKDEARYILSLLVSRDTISPGDETSTFTMDGKQSWLCARAKDDIVVSLPSSPVFFKAWLEGTVDGDPCFIRNLASNEHVEIHKIDLGIRQYKPNSAKHKPDRENSYGRGRVASPMDLDDEAAQKLLNRAIEIGERLYASQDGKVYAFQQESPGVYHGYIDDNAPDRVKRELKKYF